MFSFMLGLWLMHTVWQSQPWIAILLLSISGGLAAMWWWLRGENTGLLLVLVVVAGCFRVLPLEEERRNAAAIANTFDLMPRVLQGTVMKAETLDSSRSYVVLRNVTMTSVSSVVLLPGRLKLTLTGFDQATEGPAKYVSGDKVQALAAVQEPRTLRNFFGRSTRESLALQRIHYTATVKSPGLIRVVRSADTWSGQLKGGLAGLRRKTEQIMSAAMPQHQARLMVCMLFNDMRQLTEDDARIFRDSGTMHLFAVSGMHVAILALILNILFRACRCSPRLSWALVLAVLFLYMVLLNFITPAFRAFLMVLACTFGRILGREIDSLSSLAFGVLLIVALDPLSPWQVGFQLSIMGVIAILLVAPLFRLWFSWEKPFSEARMSDNLIHASIEALNITLAVTLLLLPLQLYYFHQFNLLSPLANLLEAALAAPVLGAALAVVVAGMFGSALASLAGASASAIMKTVYEIARWTADAEWAIIRTPEMPVLIVLLFYLLLFSGYFVVRRDTPEFHMKARARLVVHGCLCICLLAGSNFWTDFKRPLRIWFFDVGQGDSTLVQFPNGQTVLVDAGTNLPSMGGMVVLPQLKSLGISTVDYVIGTHPDSDHTGGIPDVLRRHRVRYYVEPDEEEGSKSDEITSEIRTLCSRKHIPEFQPSAGDARSVSTGCVLEVLNPPRDENAREPLKDNNRSIVIRITYGKFSALLMADAEAPVEQRLSAQKIGTCTVLKVGHHGSRTSSTPAFLAATQPKVAVISCGLRNRYGHPNPEVLARLQQTGARVLRTDVDGATLLETDGESYTIRTAASEIN
ncbi:MAG: DNA internalization-related competence protein ComEC/Rec2 [Candidatus Sumerlaeaceae bacterium]